MPTTRLEAVDDSFGSVSHRRLVVRGRECSRRPPSIRAGRLRRTPEAIYASRRASRETWPLLNERSVCADPVPRRAHAPTPGEQVRALAALARVGMSGNVSLDDVRLRMTAQVRETRAWGAEYDILLELIEKLLERYHNCWRGA